jgi:hypothetical protein
MAQLTSKGTAVFRFVPGVGSHSYKAVFVGTKSAASSVSGLSALAVTGKNPSATALVVTGSAGDYTLTATVGGNGSAAPTGTVSFLDASNGNALLGMAELAGGTDSLNFLNPSSPAVGTAPYWVAIGDFNGDGIPDLAVANYSDNDVTILLGNGDGTFTATATNPATGSDPICIAVGDFNGDGIPDLAVTNHDGSPTSTLTILLGNGDGTFTAKAESPQTGAYPLTVAVGDFNGDGVADLAVANRGSKTVSVFLGIGDGTFMAAANSPTGNAPIGIAVADFNGDGNADLAVTNAEDNTVTVLLGDGTGKFTAVASTPQTGANPEGIVAADFNGDGVPDLAVANGLGDTLTVLTGNGDGTFTELANPPSSGGYATSIVASDFNGDGKLDLAVSNLNGSDVTVLLGNGDGTFTEMTTHPATSSYTNSLAAGDLNGDGVPDLAVAGIDGGSVTVLLTENQIATAVISGISAASAAQIIAEYPGDGNYLASTSGGSGGTTPTITWPTPAPIIYGTALSAVQLDATANVAGTFVYSPAAGTVLTAGTQTLTATFTPMDTADYTTATATVNLKVNKATPTITWAAPAAIGYGTPLGSTQLDAKSPVSGAFAYSPAAGTVLAAGTHTLTATFTPADSTDYTTATATVHLTVNPGVLTVTANNASRVFGAANPAFTAAISGFVNGDTQSVVSGAAALTTTATAASPVGTYPIDAAQGTLAAANYSFAFVSGTLTVTPATVTVTWRAPGAIVYGTPLTTAQLDAAASVAGTFVYSPVAGTVLAAGVHTLSATFTPADTALYNSVTSAVQLTVNPAVLKVTANSASRVYGTANPALTATITGFVHGDAATVVSGAPVLATAATVASPAGQYAITAAVGSLSAANYTFAFGNGILTVTLASQTITFPAIGAQTAGIFLSLQATASSGLTVQYSSTTPAVCSVAGEWVLLIGSGTCSLYASQSGNGDYSSAVPVNRRFAVAPTTDTTAQTITFPPVATQVAATTINLTATASSGLPVSFQSATPSVCTVSGTTASLIAYGFCTIEAWQGGNGKYFAAQTVVVEFGVAHATQTISFAPIAAQTVGASVTLTATASSGMAVSFAAMTPAVCAVNGATATMAAAGRCDIKATDAGNNVYFAAPAVVQGFEVTRP